MRQLIKSAFNKDAISFKQGLEEELSDRIGSVLEEKFAELQEVSGKTLHQYIQRASTDAESRRNRSDMLYNKARDVDSSDYNIERHLSHEARNDLINAKSKAAKELHHKAQKETEKYVNRWMSIAKAQKKLDKKLGE